MKLLTCYGAFILFYTLTNTLTNTWAQTTHIPLENTSPGNDFNSSAMVIDPFNISQSDNGTVPKDDSSNNNSTESTESTNQNIDSSHLSNSTNENIDSSHLSNVSRANESATDIPETREGVSHSNASIGEGTVSTKIIESEGSPVSENITAAPTSAPASVSPHIASSDWQMLFNLSDTTLAGSSANSTSNQSEPTQPQTSSVSSPIPDSIPSPTSDSIPIPIPDSTPSPTPDSIPIPIPNSTLSPIPDSTPSPILNSTLSPIPDSTPSPIPDSIPSSNQSSESAIELQSTNKSVTFSSASESDISINATTMASNITIETHDNVTDIPIISSHSPSSELSSNITEETLNITSPVIVSSEPETQITNKSTFYNVTSPLEPHSSIAEDITLVITHSTLSHISNITESSPNVSHAQSNYNYTELFENELLNSTESALLNTSATTVSSLQSVTTHLSHTYDAVSSNTSQSESYLITSNISSTSERTITKEDYQNVTEEPVISSSSLYPSILRISESTTTFYVKPNAKHNITMPIPIIRDIKNVGRDVIENIVTITFSTKLMEVFRWTLETDQKFRYFLCDLIDDHKRWCIIDMIIYISPSPLVMDNNFIINFFCEMPIENESYGNAFPGPIIVEALRNSTETLKNLVGMDIISLQANLRTIIIKPPERTKERMAKFELLIFIFTVVMFFCTILLCLAIICSCIKRKGNDLNQMELSGSVGRHTSGINGTMSRGIDLNSAAIILTEERQQRNFSNVITDDKIAPLEQMIKDVEREKAIYFVGCPKKINNIIEERDQFQDTKL